MYKRIDTVQEGDSRQMSTEKPSLKVSFLDRKQEAQPRLVLNIQNEHAVVLCEVAQAVVVREKRLSNGLGKRVEQEVHNPIEHFNEEGKLGEDPAVDVVGKARRIWRSQDHTATVALLRRILGRGQDIRVARKVRFGIDGAVGRRRLAVMRQE